MRLRFAAIAKRSEYKYTPDQSKIFKKTTNIVDPN